MAHLSRAIAAAALVAVAAIGCSRDADEDPPLEVHRDIAGLTATFPAVGAPESVAWVQWSGSAGDNTQVRWTDAVVHLAPAVADAMVAQFGPTDTGRRPEVQDELAADLPGGPYLTGDRLDDGFSTDSTSTYAFLDKGHSTLVLQATSLT